MSLPHGLLWFHMQVKHIFLDVQPKGCASLASVKFSSKCWLDYSGRDHWPNMVCIVVAIGENCDDIVRKLDLYVVAVTMQNNIAALDNTSVTWS